MNVQGKRILVTGGTGSLGQVLVARLLSGVYGEPDEVVVFSRDEARQHAMRLKFLHLHSATDEVIFSSAKRCLKFRIGDVRDQSSLRLAVDGMDIVVHAAAMKQVPTCEYFPDEAHRTNVQGASNLVAAISNCVRVPGIVIGVSTDKAVKPVNVMGMTKALQERVLVKANLDCPETVFAIVRYGNVIASRGSVVPLFLDQIAAGGPLTVTDPDMTRFLVSLDQAVDAIAEAIVVAGRGDIVIPRAPSARMSDLAMALCQGRDVPMTITGIRPGEKLHEILVSEEEAVRTLRRGNYYIVGPMLPELATSSRVGDDAGPPGSYSSADSVVSGDELVNLIGKGGPLYHGNLDSVNY